MPGSRLSRSHLVKTNTKNFLKVIARAPEILKGLPKEHLELLRDKIVAPGMHRSIGHQDQGPRTCGQFCLPLLRSATSDSDQNLARCMRTILPYYFMVL